MTIFVFVILLSFRLQFFLLKYEDANSFLVYELQVLGFCGFFYEVIKNSMESS